MRADVIDDTEFKITSDAVSASATNIIPAGNVVIATRVGLGKVCLIERPTAINQDLRGIIPIDPEVLSVKYLYWWLKSVAHVIQQEGTGATVQGVKLPFVKSLGLPLRPLEEQCRIVSILDEAFEGIASAKAHAERNLRNAREWGVRESERVLGEAALTGRSAPLEALVAPGCTLSYGIVQPGEDVPNGLPVIRPVDLGGRTVSLSGLKRIDPALARSYSRTTLEGNDLLLCVRGTTGTVSVADAELAGANVTRGIVPIRFDPQQVSSRLGYYLLRSEGVQQQIRAKTYGTALMQINIGDLRQVVIAVPAMDRQAQVIQRLESVDESAEQLVGNYSRKLAALDELKQSLLHQAFSGQL